jgi:hypothetical protein
LTKGGNLYKLKRLSSSSLFSAEFSKNKFKEERRGTHLRVIEKAAVAESVLNYHKLKQ